jgi:hypothetical protein
MESHISSLNFGLKTSVLKPNPSVMDGELHELQGISTSALYCDTKFLQLKH